MVRRAPLREQLADARWVYSVDAALTPVALLGVGVGVFGDGAWRPLALMPLLALLAFFARERKARLEGIFELNRAYRGMAFVLGDVVEADDQYTGEHCKDVLELALAVGGQLGLDARRMRNLEFGALLHDVGKIAVPKEIINKPGTLTEDEFRIVKTHTIEGQRMLDRVGGFMREVGIIVRQHHERWDGLRLSRWPRRREHSTRSKDRRRAATPSTRSRPHGPTVRPALPRPRSRSCDAAPARSSTPPSSTRSLTPSATSSRSGS